MAALSRLDLVGGFTLADGTGAKALTGIDDHSRYCAVDGPAKLMLRERTRPVCEGLAAAMRTHGVPEQILTDNGRVFTGRFNQPPVEVLFDRICRENGVDHLLTAPRSPTTTGKVERFHRSLRAEFLFAAPAFSTLKMAQGALDEWVVFYNTARPHQGLAMATPEQRFHAPVSSDAGQEPAVAPRADLSALAEARTGADWVSRRVASNGVVSVSWQAVSVGKHHAGRCCDVYVTDRLLQFWVGPDLVKTAPRRSSGEVRKKRASTTTTNDEECQAGPEGPLSRTSRRLTGAPTARRGIQISEQGRCRRGDGSWWSSRRCGWLRSGPDAHVLLTSASAAFVSSAARRSAPSRATVS